MKAIITSILISCAHFLTVKTKQDLINYGNITKIEIYYSNFNALHPVGTECEDLNIIRLKKVSINNSHDLLFFTEEFNKTYKGRAYSSTIDARAKIFFYYNNGKVDEFCSSRYFILIGNKTYVYTDSLQLYLTKITS